MTNPPHVPSKSRCRKRIESAGGRYFANLARFFGPGFCPITSPIIVHWNTKKEHREEIEMQAATKSTVEPRRDRKVSGHGAAEMVGRERKVQAAAVCSTPASLELHHHSNIAGEFRPRSEKPPAVFSRLAQFLDIVLAAGGPAV